MRGASLVVAGAGLAGLTAAHDLVRRGASVTVIEARDRVGGRVLTARAALTHRQHAELGADLIDESQSEILALIHQLGLRTTRILRDGFSAVHVRRGRRLTAGRHGWQQLAKALRPEVRKLLLNEQRWEGPIAEALGRQSVADWLERIEAPSAIREVSIGLRGFFLADPDQLSLLALTDQFADEGTPGEEAMFRIMGGNDRLPALLAQKLGKRLRLTTILRRIRQTRQGVILDVEAGGRVSELPTDYLISTLPAPTLCDVVFEPELPEEQRNTLCSLKYGPATKTAIQFSRAPWRSRGRPRAFGTPLPVGAVWDGNEEQQGWPGILTLLAGGRASEATRRLLSHSGPAGLVRELTWLNLKKTKILASTSVSWEHEPWSRGGYAYFDPAFPLSHRNWLSRPFHRVFFAGEHTSIRWQGYMNGAVESGRRAAEEVALAHGKGIDS